MKSNRILVSGLLIISLGMVQAQFDATFVHTTLSPDLIWSKWGNDLRNSHYNPEAAGPTNPRLLWFLPGGAIDEPIVDGTMAFVMNPQALWVPRHPFSNNLRYTEYHLYDGLSGVLQGILWPYWGQATTPLIFQTVIYVIHQDGTMLDFVPDAQVLVLSGGQYDVLVIGPNIYWLGSLWGTPAYRSGLTAYTDGLAGYFLICNNRLVDDLITPFMGVYPVMAYAIIVVDDNGNIVEFDPYLYIDSPAAVSSGATYGIGGSSDYADVLVSVHHSGEIFGVYTNSLWVLQGLWRTTLADLSRAEPPDSTPITSDICDRQPVMSADNETVFVCASNSGRVYALNVFTGTKQWVAELGKPIMAGPSIAPDPSNGDEETLYVITRSSSTHSTLVAIRAVDGVVKWQRTLRSISRCSPTIDANGRIFIGDDRGFLYAINPDGSLLWTRYLGAAIRVSPVLAHIETDTGPIDVLYVAASNRMLYAFVESTPIRFPPGAGTGVGGSGQ